MQKTASCSGRPYRSFSCLGMPVVVIKAVLHLGFSLPVVVFLMLMLIEFTDPIFSVDSIPAIFAITTEPFITFNSNIFAILGLGALYFPLVGMAVHFHLLNYGLALIFIFIGVKILTLGFYKISIRWMLSTVFTIFAVSIPASLRLPSENARRRSNA